MDLDHWGAFAGLDPAAWTSLAATAHDPASRTQARDAFLSGVKPDCDPATAALAAVDALPTMRERHRARGVAESVSRATAADLGLWIREHHRRHGAWGLSETGWLRFHLAGRLFRLGRLQFMPAACNLPLRPGDPLRSGDPVLEVHIPAGEPLAPDTCLAAFAAAAAFPWDAPWVGFTCASWLLAPRLPEVLPPGSNVLAFQRLFSPLPCTMDDRQTIERVFGAWPLDPATAPRTTSMQRAILACYARGGRLDGGAGFRPRH